MEFPNIRHLLAFREVARARGISAASGQVHLSQPAVTQAIAGMEERLGHALFERRASGMFLTEAGEIWLRRVERFFDHLAQGARQVMRSSARHGDQAFYCRATAAQLRALVAIAETGNFSLAARRAGLSQPSIHRAGRELERLAGVELFPAGRRGVELTEAARALARAVRLAASELGQGHDELDRLAGRDSSRITVGSMPLSRSSILPQAIHALLSESAGVQVHTVDGPYDKLLRGLRNGELDLLIGAMRNPAPSDDVVEETLFHDPLAIVVGPSHPLAGQGGLTLEDTLAYPWIAPPRTTPTGSFLYRLLDIEARGLTPVRIVSSSLVLVRALLARGDYVTILSLHQGALERELGLIVPLDIGLTESARPIGLTTRRDWSPTSTQARFLDHLRVAAHGGSSEFE